MNVHAMMALPFKFNKHTYGLHGYSTIHSSFDNLSFEDVESTWELYYTFMFYYYTSLIY